MNDIKTLKDLLEISNDKYGEKTCIRYKGKDGISDKNYKQLKKDSFAIGRFLKNAFGERKMRVAIIGTASYEYVACYFGVVCSKNVVVQVDAHLSPIKMCNVLECANVDIVFYDKKLTQLIPYVKRKCQNICLFVCTNSENERDLNSLKNHIKYNIGDLNDVLDPKEFCVVVEEIDNENKITEKKMTNEMVIENINIQNIQDNSEDVVLCILPIHNAECFCATVLVALKQGSIVCFGNSIMNIVDDIKKFRPTKLEVNSSIAQGLLKNIQTDEVIRKSLKFIYSVRDYINPKLAQEYEKYGISTEKIKPMNFVNEM